MSPELSRHLGAIMSSFPLSPDERELIIDAAEEVDTYADLPPEVRTLLDEVQTR